MPARPGAYESQHRGGTPLLTHAPSIRVRLALGFQGASVAAVGFYAVLRSVQALGSPQTHDPTVLLPGAHASYFWRLWTVGYAAVMVGFLVFVVAKRYAAEVCRALLWALYIASVLLVLQGLFVP